MIQITIRRHGTDEIAIISRDVCTTNPRWIHEQLGTASESELQICLDSLNVSMWDHDPTPDVNGILIREVQVPDMHVQCDYCGRIYPLREMSETPTESGYAYDTHCAPGRGNPNCPLPPPEN